LYKLFVVIAWFGGELIGAMIAVISWAIVQGNNQPTLAITYPAALAGAVAATMIVFYVAKTTPDLRAAPAEGPIEALPLGPNPADYLSRSGDNPYQSPLFSTQALDSPQHSRVGVASFVIALLLGGLEVALFVFVGFVAASTPEGVNDDSPLVMAVGVGACLGFLMHSLGLILGIIGLAQSRQRRVFALLGTLLNGLVLVGTGLLVFTGAAAG
jgi:hypothetical protein